MHFSCLAAGAILWDAVAIAKALAGENRIRSSRTLPRGFRTQRLRLDGGPDNRYGRNPRVVSSLSLHRNLVLSPNGGRLDAAAGIEEHVFRPHAVSTRVEAQGTTTSTAQSTPAG